MFGTFASIATAIFIEAMPFLVIASLFSALIEVFVATERLLRWLPKSVAGGLIAGILGGFLIPTCECGVVPIVRRLSGEIIKVRSVNGETTVNGSRVLLKNRRTRNGVIHFIYPVLSTDPSAL